MTSYYDQNIKKLWSQPGYTKYAAAKWSPDFYPFNFWANSINHSFDISNSSVLELGSAMGAGYDYLKRMSMGLHSFTGIEVSETGCNFCKERYPEATWLNEDFSRISLTDSFDFTFERHSIHHMPRPIEQYRKFWAATKRASSTTFRGCLEGGSISNLDLAHFRTADNGKFFLNIISIPDLVVLAVELGFNKVTVVYRGIHEPIPSELNEGQGWFLDPAVNKTIIYCQILVARLDGNKTSINLSFPPGWPGFRIRMRDRVTVSELSKVLRSLNLGIAS